jgi:transcriptional regulator with GAF, ATPase, and Fis domain
MNAANHTVDPSSVIADLQEQLLLQELVSDVSAFLINVSVEGLDSHIEKSLKRIVEFLGVDRAGFGQFSEDQTELHLTHVYAALGIEPLSKIVMNGVFPKYAEKLRKGQITFIESPADLPPEAVEEKAYCEQSGMKSQLTIPFSIGGSQFCILGFDSFRSFRRWPDRQIALLKRVGEIFAHAVYRARAEQRIAAAQKQQETLFQFERLVSNLSSQFVNIDPDRVDQQIEASLEQLVHFFRLDRCALLRVSADKTTAAVTHSWNAEGIPAAPVDVNYVEYFPWHARKILANEIVSIVIKDLPAEASRDRESAEKMGILSNLVLPLVVNGSVEYVLAANSVGFERVWAEDLISRIQLLGQIFTNALTRKYADRKIANQVTELESRYEFEQLISNLSARFVSIEPDHVDHEIENGLREVLIFFNLDRCSLFKMLPDNKKALATHVCVADGIPSRAREINYVEEYPWLSAKLIAGETVSMSAEDLPPDASADRDRRTISRLGVRSFLLIPLKVDGAVRRVLTASALHGDRKWPEDVIARIRLLGEICVNAIVRKRAREKLTRSYEEIKLLKSRLEAETDYLRSEIKVAYHYADIVGESAAIREALQKVEQVALTDSSVLISGETGTGKELIARAIHNLSHRKNRAMVKINCASLPPTLIESELFGREKGAYTGALTKQVGRFEVADGSTIFLDEIGELSVELQTKLLRVLQEGEFERLGSSRTVKVNVRVIAATNRNLMDAVTTGVFREDLYYRLNVFPITVPPLRERPKDIPLLVSSFLNEFNEKMGKNITTIPKQTMEALLRYQWPGNIRELRNIVEHGVIISNGSALQVTLPQGQHVRDSKHVTLDEAERKHITQVLEITDWTIKGPNGAAKILGLKPSTLYNKMNRLGISTRRKKESARG